MTKSNGIKSLKQAAKLLNRHSPDGESLAYINPEEAKLLRAHGGSGIMTLAGVPSYIDWSFLAPVGKAITKYAPKVLNYGKQALDFGKQAKDFLGNFNIGSPAAADTPGSTITEYNDPYWQTPGIKPNAPLPPNLGDYGQNMDFMLDKTKNPFWQDVGSSILQSGKKFLKDRYGGVEGLKQGGKDVLATLAFLKGKRDTEGLNADEMKVFDELTQQTAAAQAEFQANIAGGGATNMPETIEDVASYTDVTLPTMKTTAVAEGGRIGFNSGGETEYEKWLIDKYDLLVSDLSWDDHSKYSKLFRDQKAQGGRIGAFNGGIQGLMPQQGFMPQPGLDPRMGYAAQGGRIGFGLGSKTGTATADPNRVVTGDPTENLLSYFSNKYSGNKQVLPSTGGQAVSGDNFMANMISQSSQGSQFQLLNEYQNYVTAVGEENAVPFEEWQASRMTAAHGGRIGAAGGGIMPLLNMGGMEKDYRQDGGFVPIGRKEKADDVPARLSKNEFVFTADAVRAAGGGDIDQGAQRMYNVMKNLEAGGQISQQSQGKR